MYYVFEPAQELSPTTTQLATVRVFTANNKEIGHYSFTRSNPSDTEIERMAGEIVRECQLARIWNGKALLK